MAKVKKEKLSLEELLEQALVKEEDRPYEVPGNWVWTTLKNVSGKITDGSHNPPPNRLSGVPILSARNILNYEIDFDSADRWITEEEWVQENKRTDIEINDVLLTIVGSIGRTAVVGNEKFALQRSVAVIKPISTLPKYLSYYLSAPYMNDFLNQNAKGTAQKGFYLNALKLVNFPLPPYAEQQRIVKIIESLFEKLDTAKELVQNALDSFDNRKASILHKAFTGELTAKWREENGVSLEKDWIEKDLAGCGTWYGGGTPSKGHSDFWDNGTLLWVTPKDMKSMYIEDTEDKITEVAVNNSSTKLIHDNAILIVVRSGILRRILPIAITTKPVTVNQDMKVIVPKNIDIKFLYWYCVCKESDIREKCAKSGTTVESISSELLYKYKISIPSMDEQKEIVRILDNLLENEQHAKELCDVIEKIDLMKKAILARAFRGELGTNVPNEESAIELLKEVLKEKLL